MPTLREIQNDLVNDDKDLSSILRKIKIFAVEVKSKKLAKCCDLELNGYNNNIDLLPDYRKLKLECRVDTINDYGTLFKNQPIGLNDFPEEIKSAFCKTNILDGVKSLESFCHNDQKKAHINLSNDVISTLNKYYIQGGRILQAYKIFSRNQIEQLLDTSRNRFLDLILELIEKNPDIKNENANKTIDSTLVNDALESHISASYNSFID